MGKIRHWDAEAGSLRVEADMACLQRAWNLGDSIAVDGCCLTVTAFDDHGFEVVVSPETIRCTTFKEKEAGSFVNLEAALKVGDPLGGHFVTGHVDGVGKLVESKPVFSDQRRMVFHAPSHTMPFVALKGSIAVNGVSLTINHVEGEHFAVHLIPHTLQRTNLGLLKEGDAVNIEIDLLARYLGRLLESSTSWRLHEPRNV